MLGPTLVDVSVEKLSKMFEQHQTDIALFSWGRSACNKVLDGCGPAAIYSFES